MSDDLLGVVKETAQEVTQLPGEVGNLVGEGIGDFTGWNDRYESGVPPGVQNRWRISERRAINAGMAAKVRPGGTNAGLQAKVLGFSIQLTNAFKAAADTSDGADYAANCKDLGEAIAEATMNFVLNAQLNGPVKSAGTGFSFGSPFFHMVVLPFGDAELTPLCHLS